MAVEIYIARHATPDWHRTDIPYDIAPGPPLTPQGEREAIALGEFLHSRSVQKIYASPLERAHQTGLLAAQIMDLEVTVSGCFQARELSAAPSVALCELMDRDLGDLGFEFSRRRKKPERPGGVPFCRYITQPAVAERRGRLVPVSWRVLAGRPSAE